MKKEKIINLKYKIENPFLKKWSLSYGIIECMTKLQICMQSDFGYMGDQRIDRDFIKSLSKNDRDIYNCVISWIDQDNRTMKTIIQTENEKNDTKNI